MTILELPAKAVAVIQLARAINVFVFMVPNPKQCLTTFQVKILLIFQAQIVGLTLCDPPREPRDGISGITRV